MSDISKVPFYMVAFGEAMIRFAPSILSEEVKRPEDELAKSNTTPYEMSVGGDELNVCVALARLGTSSQWISVVAEGPLGDAIMKSACQVDLSKVVRVKGDCGLFFVQPELQTVHYQRHNGVFALQAPNTFNWKQLLTREDARRPWLHVTGITPSISEAAYNAWDECITAAKGLDVPVSLDVNHRKQLIDLPTLLQRMERHLSYFEFIVLSTAQIRDLASHYDTVSAPPSEHTSLAGWIASMRQIKNCWKARAVACCFKTRDATGLQTRWSVVVCDAGVFSTFQTPTLHRVRDELGGGSAWVAGVLDELFHQREATTGDMDWEDALRQGDRLAALCQNSKGDFSNVTRDELKRALGHEDAKTQSVSVESPDAVIERTLKHIEEAGVVAIIRAQHADQAVKLGLELAQLGAHALEVSLDTPHGIRVLKQLRAELPPHCLLGVGTVFDVGVLHELKDVVSFALSPINPKGFIETCHAYGILAVPAGSTASELWHLHQQGARLLKVFPAHAWSPRMLAGVLKVGKLCELRLLPTGGIDCDNYQDWLDAGAAAVGMGHFSAHLASGSAEKLRQWELSGRDRAREIFQGKKRQAAS